MDKSKQKFESVVYLQDDQPESQVDITINGHNEPLTLQKLEEKAQKAQEAFEKEEKLRKELEALNSKMLAEKTALLDSLSGEKGALQDYQEKCAKLTAQKNDLDNQLRVSIHLRNIALKVSQLVIIIIVKKIFLIRFTWTTRKYDLSLCQQTQHTSWNLFSNWNS